MSHRPTPPPTHPRVLTAAFAALLVIALGSGALRDAHQNFGHAHGDSTAGHCATCLQLASLQTDTLDRGSAEPVPALNRNRADLPYQRVPAPPELTTHSARAPPRSTFDA